MTPNPRSLFGSLFLVAGLVLYAGAAIRLALLAENWPIWAETVLYAALGLLWLLPARWLLGWMAGGQSKKE